MRSKVKEIACPACLRKRLRVFRVESPSGRSYFVNDPRLKVAYEFTPWQFFVLELLTECDGFPRLALLVEDRYGEPIAETDLDALLAFVTEKKLLAMSEPAPLLASFERRRPHVAQPPGGVLPRQLADRDIPVEVQHALALSPETATHGWKLFDPTPVFRSVHPVLAPLRRAIYLLPLLLAPAVIIALRYQYEFARDLRQSAGDISLLTHAVLGMFTENLVATFAGALVAYHYGVTVSAFCVVFYFGIWPRFMYRIASVEHLPRRARAWFYAAPLLARLLIFSVTVLSWLNTRSTDDFLARFSLVVAFISEVSFLLTVLPLLDSSGYRLLATLLDSANLRPRATIALTSQFRDEEAPPGVSKRLVVFGAMSILFVVGVMVAFGFLLKQYFAATFGGAAGALIIVTLAAVLVYRGVPAIKRLNQANARAARFRKWQKRGTHEAE